MSDFREIRMSTDELTGLLDKQTFYECAQDLVNSAADDQEFTFIFFDLENFKIFNVNYGYAIGDELLTSIGYIMKDVFEGQLISRFSGDHFVVCANSSQIVPAIKNIRERIKLIQRAVNVELKAGIYIYDGEEKDVIRCCDRARMACISIKKKYDVEYRFYDNELGGNLKRKQEILDSLDEAIEKKYIKVYYQPIVRTLTGQVCSWEALVRWIDPVKGMIFPNEFIPVLEEYRLIPKIDAFVIEEVFSKYQANVAGKLEAAPVSINLSRIDFEVTDLVAYIDEKIAQYNCPKDMFHFEVTESALMENPQFIMEQIRIMREKGYVVWMDDFGSGYSSLNVLKNYEFGLVKIDMDFLKDFDTSDNGKIILRHIVSMIKNLNIHTLIEGVETQEQYDFLKSIGCEMIQGYLIGRPMPYMQALECVKNDGRSIETREERQFYQEIGSIDILRQNPLQNIENSGIENPLPLAIFIKDHGIWRIIYANSGMRKVASILGANGIENVEGMINSGTATGWAQKQHFLEICEHSKQTKRSETMDFIENGRIVNLRVRYICEESDTDIDAYLISIRLLSRFLNSGYETRVNAISRAIFTQYECVDLYGINDDYFENIYLNDSRLHVDFEGQTPSEIIKNIATNLVHPNDKYFFEEFFDLRTIKERLMQEPNGTTIGFYRIRDKKRTFVWKAISLSMIRFENRDLVMCCIAEASREIARRMNDAAMGVQYEDDKVVFVQRDDSEYKDILQVIPLGVFWKDKERRFLGANQMFLDYYGFRSVEEILGKTDEDMGWHINPEPFKRDELAVINEGKVIENVHGECIVRGQVRKIVANKQPYVVDREVRGLVGYFRDITDELQEYAKLEKLTLTDSLTGHYNRRAFKSIAEKYVLQYEQAQTDFAILMLDIDRFKQINDMYGHDYGDEVLKKTSKVLRYVASENSVVFRFGGDEFVIMHQYKNQAELESIKQEIRIELGKEDRITKSIVPIKVSIGEAIYSEFGDITKCLDAADKKMYIDKEKRKKR